MTRRVETQSCAMTQEQTEVVIYLMDARRSKRTVVTIEAQLVSGQERHACFIENLSEEGAYLVVATSRPSSQLLPETPMELRFQLPSGEKYRLPGKVIWTFKTPPHGLTDSIGIEFSDPPLTFTAALRSLS